MIIDKKMRLLAGICSCFIFISCSIPSLRTGDLSNRKDGYSGVFYTINIQRWGELKFSGLLAVKNSGGILHYILLDLTGITLLESAGNAAGKLQEKARGPLAATAIEGFLTSALNRIFFEIPEKLPCSRHGLQELCYRADDGDNWTKIYRIWPFTFWGAAKHTDENLSIIYEYRQPWLGVEIFLKEFVAAR